ncbi:MAG: NAD(+)/NADH kinase [Bacilli bacterium]|jgi:NAD+ kinase|nr:NAD(+)/NADH kinase [Bacilli bacterium]
MFRFTIFANDRHPYLKKEVEDFCAHFIREGNLRDDVNPQIIFVFGGDGTLLAALKALYQKNAPFMLINDGTLGFYKECDLKDIAELYQSFSFEKLILEKHRFISLTDEEGNQAMACNEFVLGSSIRTMDFVIYINNDYFMEVKGSGVCISSPFGSSGYNHSLNGALLGKENGMAISLIAPIRNRIFHPLVNSLVTGLEDTVQIEIINDIPFELAGDMRLIASPKGKKFSIKMSEVSFSLAHSKPFSEYQRIRKNFIEN